MSGLSGVSGQGAHLSALARDELALGALAPEEAAAVRAHLAECAACRSEVERDREMGQLFAAKVLPRTVGLVAERLGQGSWFAGLRGSRTEMRPWRTLFVVPALVAAAVALVLLPRLLPLARHAREAEGLGSNGLGIKGGPALQIFARRESRVFPVHEGTPLTAGDQIRFQVEPAGMSYLLVASIDGAGKATVYYPWQGQASGRLPDGGRLQLPGSVVLDAAPGPERIFALFSARPLASGVVRAALMELSTRGEAAIRATRQLGGPVGVQAPAQVSLLLEKSR